MSGFGNLSSRSTAGLAGPPGWCAAAGDRYAFAVASRSQGRRSQVRPRYQGNPIWRRKRRAGAPEIEQQWRTFARKLVWEPARLTLLLITSSTGMQPAAGGRLKRCDAGNRCLEGKVVARTTRSASMVMLSRLWDRTQAGWRPNRISASWRASDATPTTLLKQLSERQRDRAGLILRYFREA